jgi:hypothetical protein
MFPAGWNILALAAFSVQAQNYHRLIVVASLDAVAVIVHDFSVNMVSLEIPLRCVSLTAVSTVVFES